jgi:DNA-binding CsgD family transcriptional regulator
MEGTQMIVTPTCAAKGLAEVAAPSSQVWDQLIDQPSKDLEDAGPRNFNLTERQKAVLEFLSRGDPNKAIARRLGMREGTVKVHVRQIMRKLGVTNRTQVAIVCANGVSACTAKASRSAGSMSRATDIPLNAAISAAIDGQSDVGFFSFVMPDTRRDIIDVVLNNDSTTLAPRITVYGPDKGQLGEHQNSTRGGDVSYSWVAQPNTRYYVRVDNAPYVSAGDGNYRLTVRARKAFDQYEPNDDILSASLIEISKTIEANIMDPGDVDYYQFTISSALSVMI